MSTVNGVTYTWDANGNLLSDGQNSYTYDDANRLASVSNAQGMVQYAYNGLGDRLSQSMNGSKTVYHLDLNAGLTQVLDDGQRTYLYGNGRVGYTADDAYYYLGDALGSVRAVVQGGIDAPVVMTRDYAPYGEVLAGQATNPTPYGYTGEWTDASGLVYLRARYYRPMDGRFTSKDTWDGDNTVPISYHKWLYVYDNPITYIDPSGNQTEASQPCSEDFRYCRLVNFNNAVIDVHHFYDSRYLASEITTEMDKGLGRDSYYFILGRTLNQVIPYSKIYRTSLPETIQKGGQLYNGVALGIFMNFQYGLESFESLNSLVPVLCANGHCSGFSNEDLPTDYLGFIAEVVKGGWSITDVANKFGGGVGLNEFPGELSGSKMDAFRCSVFNSCGEDNPYNTCWEFKLPGSEEKYQYVAWPSDLIVYPEKEGSHWNEYIVPITTIPY